MTKKSHVSLNESDNVTIVGHDVDWIVLLTDINFYGENIYLYKPGQGKVLIQLFPLQQQQKVLTHIILLAHSFSGYNIILSYYRKK